jgi:arginyl-tRNA--protein-N-Asp/Glu arginylyltransferase
VLDHLLDLYITTPSPCGYLADRDSVSVVADPARMIDSPLYGVLVDRGFRRSGRAFYRPQCPECVACVPVRVPVDRFAPSRSQRRVWRANEGLDVVAREPCLDEAHYQLFRRYQREHHRDTMQLAREGEDPRTGYFRFLVETTVATRFYEYRLGDRLVAVGVVDHLPQGLSTVYFFFDPIEGRRSLGTYSVLWEITETRKLGLPYYYLGYWIRDCRKMAYKASFSPLEYLVNGQWQAESPT